MFVEKFNINSKGFIQGKGSDSAGDFVFKGRVNVKGDYSFTAGKEYPTWTIYYFG